MNTFKTALLLTGLTLLLVVGGGAIAGERGMTFALVGAIVMNGIAYFFSWTGKAAFTWGSIPILK